MLLHRTVTWMVHLNHMPIDDLLGWILEMYRHPSERTSAYLVMQPYYVKIKIVIGITYCLALTP
jgi:hypothetical protein